MKKQIIIFYRPSFLYFIQIFWVYGSCVRGTEPMTTYDLWSLHIKTVSVYCPLPCTVNFIQRGTWDSCDFPSDVPRLNNQSLCLFGSVEIDIWAKSRAAAAVFFHWNRHSHETELQMHRKCQQLCPEVRGIWSLDWIFSQITYKTQSDTGRRPQRIMKLSLHT